MSSIFNNILGAFGFGQPVAQIDTRPAVPAEQPVKPADPVDRSNDARSYSGRGEFPGYDTAPPLTIRLIWDMRRFSTIVLAHTIVTAPILAGKQSIEIVSKRNQALAERMKAAAEEDILPTVPDWLPGMAECLHFGNFVQEAEWQRANGRILPVAYHSVLPDEAVIYRDQFRRFTGFEVNGIYRDARYALLAVNNAHIDPIFGESRNAACREEWWRIRQGELNADKMEKKASGIQMGIGVPMGASFVDDNNKPIFPKDLAQTIVNSAAQGQTFTYPLYAFTKKDIVAKPELAERPAAMIEAFDWGNIGPSMMAHLARKGVGAIDIMRAWHRPEREAMQGTSGTNAESETQGAIGTTDSELVAYQAMRQFTKQVLDRWAVTNFGPDAAGLIAIKQAPLSDPQQAFLQKIALAMAASTQPNAELPIIIDERQLCERTELPVISPADAATKMAQAAQAAKDAAAATKPAPVDPNAPTNGKGKLAIAASENGHRSRVEQLFQDALRDG